MPNASDETTADFMRFIQRSPTPYHAVEAAASHLSSAGFHKLSLADSWRGLSPGGYVVAREGTLIAFVLPAGSRVGSFALVGAHTDSPNLRLKPLAEITRHGYRQLGVEVYGGALLASWLDRDLGLAGRVLRRGGSEPEPLLLQIERPLLRVAQLAIHLDRDVNERGVVLNRQEHLAPIWGEAVKDAPSLVEFCAAELGIAAADVVGLDLMLYDITAPSLGGAQREFIFSARLDNLAMCHAGVSALGDVGAKVEGGRPAPVLVLFDHEEVGSQTAGGAASSLLPSVLERVVLASDGSREDYHRALARSMCVSADMAHAVHPNYADKHEAQHQPKMNGGPVIKMNAQQRYATQAPTAARFAELCRAEEVPVQHYVHRTDLPCGSTIGPITATVLGIPTVDVGNAMLSMHSVREMAGARDPVSMRKVLRRFFSSATANERAPLRRRRANTMTAPAANSRAPSLDVDSDGAVRHAHPVPSGAISLSAPSSFASAETTRSLAASRGAASCNAPSGDGAPGASPALVASGPAAASTASAST
jgi:aspartyl aminopeptidase